MRKRLFTFAAAFFILLSGHAQGGHTGTTGDMRNFASQTSISFELNAFTKKSNVVGSQFLFDDWVKGKVVTTDGQEFADGLYNFNKVSQNLYVQMKDTTGNVGFLVDKGQLKSISLSDGTQSYLLEKVASLDAGSFYRVLAKGNKYSLYSKVKTKFIASNYESNGIVSSGNMYDEYKDEVTYYVGFADGSVHEISLKKKSIKSVLEADKETVDQYFKKNGDADLNETFLSLLVTSLNQ